MGQLVDRSILGFWQDKELRLEAAHILDRFDIVLRKGVIQVTPFLSLALQNWAEGVLRREGLAYLLAGGYPEAERNRLVIGPAGEELTYREAEVSLVWVCPADPGERLEHRQLLGSLLGLGLKREVVGDIRPGPGGMYVAITNELASFLVDEWHKAGRSKINITLWDELPDLLPEEAEERRITIASNRLDAIIAGGFGVSRTVAQEWIGQGKIKRNDLAVTKSDAEVRSGDVLSCRGQGRLKLLSDEGHTRKGRAAFKVALLRSHRN